MTTIIIAVAAFSGLGVWSTLTGAFDPLAQREIVVMFKDGTPRAERAHVRADCAAPPAVVAEPMGPGDRKHARLNDVRYRVDDASDGQIASASGCLNKHPSVVGVDLRNLAWG